jgi:hypothetical protein
VRAIERLNKKEITTMKTNLLLAALFTASMAMAQVMIPDGTKIRVRLEENLSSETADLGQTVDFAVTQELRVGDAIVVANGARATGSIVKVEQRRRMGRAGILDFSIERVQMVDGNWLNVRYTPNKNKGKGNGATAGVATGILAVVFWPAAPPGPAREGTRCRNQQGPYLRSVRRREHLRSRRGGRQHSADDPRAAARAGRDAAPGQRRSGEQRRSAGRGQHSRQPVLVSNTSMLNTAQGQPVAEAQGAAATLTINANQPGADILVDGMFVGNAPTTIQLAPGVHKVVLQQGSNTWQRDLQITGGSVTINATLGRTATLRASR